MSDAAQDDIVFEFASPQGLKVLAASPESEAALTPTSDKKGIKVDATMPLREQLEKNRRENDAGGGGKGNKRGREKDDGGDVAKKKKGHVSANPSSVCILDGRPVKPNKRFCEEHATAHECIWRKAMKGCDKKNKKFTDQAIAYMTIFGDRKNGYPGDDEAAKETLAQFCRQFPPEEDGKKTGKPRGDLDLTQFVRTKLAAAVRAIHIHSRAIHMHSPAVNKIQLRPPCSKPTRRHPIVRTQTRRHVFGV